MRKRRLNIILRYASGKYSKFQRRTIAASRLFDREFYIGAARKAGSPVRGVDPIVHYLLVGDAKRIPTHPLFDTFYYHDAYRDIDGSGMAALFHFISFGWKEFRNPHPLVDLKYIASQVPDNDENPLLAYLDATPGTIDPHPDIDDSFIREQGANRTRTGQNSLTQMLSDASLSINPSKNFDVKKYRLAHPDTEAYHPLYHYVYFGKSEGRDLVSTEYRVANMIDQINLAASLDPDVLSPHTDVAKLRSIRSIAAAGDLSILFRFLHAAHPFLHIDHMFLVPHIELGGAEKVMVNLLYSISSINSDSTIVIVVTDSLRKAAVDWIPQRENIKVLFLHPFAQNLDRASVLRCFAIYLQVARVKNVHTINSMIGWELFEKHGISLSQFMKLHGFAFCYDFDAFGRRAGYAWTHLKHCIDNLTHVISDNTPMVHVFCKDLALTNEQAAKFEVLRQPVEINETYQRLMETEYGGASETSRPRVLWAARFHRQKNIAVAFKTARLMPDVDFYFAGGEPSELDGDQHETCENAIFLGRYDGFNALLDRRFDIFLHTADWDGLPNVVLEAGASGIPVVARSIGGVPDIVTEETAWPVGSSADEVAFVAAIRAALSDPSERRRRAHNLLRHIKNHHSWKTFTSETKKVFPDR